MANDVLAIHPVKFDASGVCVSPEARSAVITEAARNYSHIVVLAHGWNNTWPQALARFTRWRDGTIGPDTQLNPLLIGVFWPSTWLTSGSERGPALASSSHELAEVIPLLPAKIQPAMRRALTMEKVGVEEAQTLARTAAGVLPPDDISGAPPNHGDAEDVLARWASLSGSELRPVKRRPGVAGRGASHQAQVAGLSLDPRDLVRMVSVWTMHDRARTVGRTGVAALLDDLTEVTSTPIHLVGHSYGGQVQLAAVSKLGSGKKVESVLLLQPAVNYLCLSARLPDGAPSGYRNVPSQLRQPLLTTYSQRDFPLTKMFHRALRRAKDVGEVAAWPYPPSRYAALGGYGPGELGDECAWSKLPVPATSEALTVNKRVHALDGSNHISGHGDVTNEACCGLLRSQLLSATETGGHL